MRALVKTKSTSIHTVLAALLLVAGLGLAVPAGAQIGKEGGPIDIRSDTFEVLDPDKRAVFTGKVEVLQGSSYLRSQKLTVEYAGRGTAKPKGSSGSFGDIRKLIAEGDVYYGTALEKARGDRGVYDAVSDTITLTGNVVVTRDGNVITGTQLVIDVANGKSRMSNDGSKGRVRAVFTPGSTSGGN